MAKRVLLILLGLVAATIAVFLWAGPRESADQSTRLMTRGNGYLEKGDATNAIAAYSELLKLSPESLDARLNLANACLLANDTSNTIEQCKQALALDANSAAAFYLMGCAYLRDGQAEQAVQALQQSEQIDAAVTALHFQLGLAQAHLGHYDEAITQFAIVVQFQPDHPSVHYQLSQIYQCLGRVEDAATEMQKHQETLAKHPGAPSGELAFEQCKYTQPRLAFKLEQPDLHGVPVHFVDATSSAFTRASDYHGPIAVVDYNHDGHNGLFVMEGDKGFRILENQGGHFAPSGELLPGKPGANYRACLAGDINNDGFDDVIVLGEQISHAFRFATNGQCREVTAFSGLKDLKVRDGLLADLDFTGKLDLLAVLPDGNGLRVFQNLGNFYFKDNTADSGLPADIPGAEQVAVEDWNNEDVPGVFVTRNGKAPALFPKQRAGTFVETNSPSDWPIGNAIALGDLDNDLRPDMVVAGESDLEIVYGSLSKRAKLPLRGLQVKGILLTDYDNDGWLDIIAFGNGIRVWRNLGNAGFADVTSDLGLEKIGSVDALVAADFDNAGAPDLIFSTPDGLRFWRNQGGNANHSLKLRLVGSRSNASALGVRVELAAGNWHAIRTQKQMPLEIGLGKHDKLDALKVRWFDLASTLVDVTVPTNAMTLEELNMPSGSCPYLYKWDGKHFKFVTDILGAAPLGLPVSKTHLIEADPEEFLALGNDTNFPTKDNAFEIRITEELREVLYLDEASLEIVDHPIGTQVVPTSKLNDGKPFSPHELWTLRQVAQLRHATRSDGLNVTKALSKADNDMVSPIHLREPQLRGLAEPFSVTMDFGEIPSDRPLVLELTGWLRFGGGMANIAGSLDPNLPFPFPTLEGELPDGSWKRIDVQVGAPCGKTKTILVDLENKLPPGTRRLRLTTAFEIYWDAASLCEKIASTGNGQYSLHPAHTDLHWRGFSEFEPLPGYLPLTPDYEKLQAGPPWRRTPSGWCTRYGAVDELLQEADDALVLLNGGDELAISFPADKLPPKPDGYERDFFLHVVGWDKDADFHVAQGWRVEPLPWRGMDDEAYGHQPRPATFDNEWMAKYNTRWVGPMVLSRTRSSEAH